jgi:predicted aspartyl protease
VNGTVTRLQAMLPLAVIGPEQRTLDVEAIIDTGFTGF